MSIRLKTVMCPKLHLIKIRFKNLLYSSRYWRIKVISTSNLSSSAFPRILIINDRHLPLNINLILSFSNLFHKNQINRPYVNRI